MSFERYISLMPTKDIERHIVKLEKELASDYDGWSAIVDKRRDSMRKTLEIYEKELVDKILLEDE